MIVNHGNGSVVNNIENTIIIKPKFRHKQFTKKSHFYGVNFRDLPYLYEGYNQNRLFFLRFSFKKQEYLCCSL